MGKLQGHAGVPAGKEGMMVDLLIAFGLGVFTGVLVTTVLFCLLSMGEP